MIVTWLRLEAFAGACVKHEMAKRPNGTPVSLNSTSVSLNGVLTQCKSAVTTNIKKARSDLKSLQLGLL